MKPKVPSVANLGHCPSLAGPITRKRFGNIGPDIKEDALECTKRSTLKETEASVDSIRWQVEMTALTSVLIGLMWEEIKAGKFEMKEHFTNAGFWPNFVESLLVFFTREQYLVSIKWQEKLKLNEGGFAPFLSYYKRYLQLWNRVDSSPAMQRMMPDFRDFVAIVTKLNLVMEEFFEQNHGRTIGFDEAKEALSEKSFMDLQIQLMANNKKVAGDFLEYIQVAGNPILKTRTGYGLPIGVNGKYNLDKFEVVGESPLKIWFRPEVVVKAKEDAEQSLSMVDESEGYVKNCPVLYTGIYPELLNWYKKIYLQSRFGVVENP